MSVNDLKRCNPGLVVHVANIWVKQAASPLDHDDPVRWKTPTFPYEIKYVDQVAPTKDNIEVFEKKRNELEARSQGKKLETLHLFYRASNDDIHNRIVQTGFHNVIVGAATFSPDPLKAILDSYAQGPATKLILARACLGTLGQDYKEIRDKYTILDLKSVVPAFVIYVKFIQPEQTSQPSPSLERRDSPVEPTTSPWEGQSTSSPPLSPVSTSNFNNARLPKYLSEEALVGIQCECGQVAGPGSSGRFCINCGAKIP